MITDPSLAAAPVPTLTSFCDRAEADDGNGNVTFMFAPAPVTVTSFAVRFVVFNDGDAELEADADDELPFDVPDVLEHEATARAKTGTVVSAATRASLEVTRSTLPAAAAKVGSYMPAINFSTRSSTLRKGSLHSTVRAAWSLSFR